MGCNTSKESVQVGAEEAKEDVKNGDIPKSAASENNKEEISQGVDKTELTKPDSGLSETKQDTQGETTAAESDDPSDKEKEEAATRIQAVFRGHKARKSIRDTDNSSYRKNSTEIEPTEKQLQQEFPADDADLCNAATKIQASFRGHMSRKEQTAAAVAKAAGDMVESAINKVEEKVDDAINEIEGIDLTDPDLHKAATKIQASFRGHKVRQEVPETIPTKK